MMADLDKLIYRTLCLGTPVPKEVKRLSSAKWLEAVELIEAHQHCSIADKFFSYHSWWRYTGDKKCAFCDHFIGNGPCNACGDCPLKVDPKELCHPAWNTIYNSAKEDPGVFIETFERCVPLMFEAIQACKEEE